MPPPTAARTLAVRAGMRRSASRLSAASMTSTSRMANPLRLVYELSGTNPAQMVVSAGRTRLASMKPANAPPATRSRPVMALLTKNVPAPTRANAETTMAGRLACVVMPGVVPMQNRLGTLMGLRAKSSPSRIAESPACAPLPPKSDSAVGSSTAIPVPTARAMVAAKRTQRRRRRPRSSVRRASSYRKYSTHSRHTIYPVYQLNQMAHAAAANRPAHARRCTRRHTPSSAHGAMITPSSHMMLLA